MSLQLTINSDIKSAMIAKDKVRLSSLRAIKSEIMLVLSKDGSSEINDDAVLKILQKLQKQRKDAAQIYIDQNRQDLADEELTQAEVMAEYLPKQMSEEELKSKVSAIIADMNAGPSDMGKVMGRANKELAGKAEGRLIAACVKQLLA
jgi:uncharacterized protein YqeY